MWCVALNPCLSPQQAFKHVLKFKPVLNFCLFYVHLLSEIPEIISNPLLQRAHGLCLELAFMFSWVHWALRGFWDGFCHEYGFVTANPDLNPVSL